MTHSLALVRCRCSFKSINPAGGSTTITRARTIGFATNELAHVGQVALELLREYAPARPVRLVGVRVASFGGVEAPPLEVAQLALEL